MSLPCPHCGRHDLPMGWLCNRCHEIWLADPDRHVHGAEPGASQRRQPVGPPRVIYLEPDPRPVSGRPPGCRAHVSAVERRHWDGAWDNAVRIWEEQRW